MNLQSEHRITAASSFALALLLSALCCPNVFAANKKVDISGLWTLDETLSDDPEAQLKDIGKTKSKKAKPGDTENRRGDKPVGDDTFRRYWEHVADDKEWRRVANAAHKGSIKSLVLNTRLAIASTESGFKVWYQDGFVRDINPNPYGRVFSASGDELVANDLGRTLSYVKKRKIISETRVEPRGDILETFEPSEDQQMLTVTIKIDRPDWRKIVELKKVYRRSAAVADADSTSDPVQAPADSGDAN